MTGMDSDRRAALAYIDREAHQDRHHDRSCDDAIDVLDDVRPAVMAIDEGNVASVPPISSERITDPI